MTQVSQYLKTITSRLSPLSDTPYLDAQVLIAHVVGKSRTWVLAHPEYPLEEEQQSHIEGALERLENGEALPYVLGNWDFFGLNFTLSPEVLIPRPETELLVERALQWLRDHPRHRSIVDIGTGSGCIAVSLGFHIHDLTIYAQDISFSALRTAHHNTSRYHLGDRLHLLQSDVRTPLPLVDDSIDMICGNLPYIPSQILKTLDVYRHEPSLALEGGQDGLDLIRSMLVSAPRILVEGGVIFLEIEASQGQAAQEMAQDTFPESDISLVQDLAGRDRLVVIET